MAASTASDLIANTDRTSADLVSHCNRGAPMMMMVMVIVAIWYRDYGRSRADDHLGITATPAVTMSSTTDNTKDHQGHESLQLQYSVNHNEEEEYIGESRTMEPIIMPAIPPPDTGTLAE
jgi:hypothetical protein